MNSEKPPDPDPPDELFELSPLLTVTLPHDTEVPTQDSSMEIQTTNRKRVAGSPPPSTSKIPTKIAKSVVGRLIYTMRDNPPYIVHVSLKDEQTSGTVLQPIKFGPLHRFPKWDYPHTEKFDQWKSILNPITIARGNEYIYNNIRLCYRHFQKHFQLPSHRLTKNAVPTLNLFSLSQSEEQPSTSADLDIHEDSLTATSNTDFFMAPSVTYHQFLHPENNPEENRKKVISAGADSVLFKMTSKVQTVLGDVSPSDLGRTLTHEHLGMNFEHFYRPPPSALARKFTGPELELETIGYVRQYPYSLRYNLKLDDHPAEQAVIYDVIEYKTAGGGTIVENTTEGINRHLSFYQNVSKASNVHIVAGTGHYIADLQSGDTLKQSTEDVYNHMLQELTKGCVTQPDVKAGFMGEIASVWPLRDFERRAIQAAGELQPQLGCGVSFHPHRTKEAPFEIIRLYLEAGGSADKVVMSHLDRTLVEDDILLEFAELGTYCQFDLFGTEVSYYQLEVTTDMLSDAQRIQKISLLVQEGREDKILMSHDIHTKHRLTKFGGHGYAHIINNVLPKMISKGFTQQQIDNITIGNPARWLAIEK